MRIVLLFKLFLIKIIRLFLTFISKFCGSYKCAISEITDVNLLKPAIVIADEVKKGRLKSRDVITAYMRRIKEINPVINAIVEMNREALDLADQIDERIQISPDSEMFGLKMQDMPLLGVPVTVKDSIAVKQMLFTGGLYSRRTNFATEDATVIKNIRKAGAIPIANSNVGELSMSTDTDNNFIGFTYNPYDLSRTPGAGGGGESALIASGCSVVGVGADVAASLRWPAFCCGIFGHKVTSGVLPVQGLFPEISEAISHLFTIGPFCRYACDIIPMIKAMAGEDIKYLPNIDLAVDVSKIKLYYMFTDDDPYKPPLSEDMKSALLEVVNHFKTKYKIECSQVHFEEFSIAADLWTQAFTQGHDFHEEMSNGIEKLSISIEMLKSAFGLSKHTKRSLLFAYFARNDPNFDQSKVIAFEQLQKKFEETLRNDGVFLYPSMSTVAQKRILTYLDSCNIGYTCVFNLLNAPVTQCPLGLNADGIPLGIQVAANAYNDHLTIAVAKEIEATLHGWVPPCCLRTDIDSLNESITQQ